MTTTKLSTLFSPTPHPIEAQDVLAAFRRCVGRFWGERVPVEPVRWSRHVLTVACASTLWRTEVLYHTENLKEELLRELPTTLLRRIAVLLV